MLDGMWVFDIFMPPHHFGEGGGRGASYTFALVGMSVTQ